VNKLIQRLLCLLPIAAALAVGLDGAGARAAVPPIVGRGVRPRIEVATNAELVAAAKSSPLYRRTLDASELGRAGLRSVRVVPGMEMDFARYVQETGLPRQPELAPLFDAKLPAGVLTGAPAYAESVHELQDRLVVDRRLTIPLAPGACTGDALPDDVAHLCFGKGDQDMSDAVRQDLAQIRRNLVALPADAPVRGDVTAEEAAAMDDEALLDLVLNAGERTIHHVSIVPRQPVARAAARGGALSHFGSALASRGFVSGLTEMVAVDATAGSTGGLGPDATAQATRYFLTGFTYGKEIDDSWEYTFANATWLTDRYYVKVDYHVGLGLGLRAPFAVNVASSPVGAVGAHAFGERTRNVALSVAPVDVDSNGLPAYPAVGLPASKTFGGRELVLELKASCKLYVSIPGPNISKSCPSIDVDYSRDVDPVIGGGVSSIGDWWLDGATTGLGADFGVVSASIDIGLGLDVRNGLIGMRSTALPNSQIAGGGAGNLQFASTNPIVFTVSRDETTANGGFRLDNPTYKFDVRATPKLRAKVGVDVAIYENEWIIGPYALDFLAIEANFQLGHHSGTIAKHDVLLFQTLAPSRARP